MENSLVVKDFGEFDKKENSTQMSICTTIEDIKTLYNLDNGDCDFKLNDCKGMSIRVKDVLVKNFDKYIDDNGEKLEKPINKKVTILIDDQGKSYVTASKMFALQILRFIGQFGKEVIKNGLEIKIIEREIKGSKNKGLGFELV